MHSLDVPAGSAIRLTATARSDRGVHRWDVQVFESGQATPGLAYGSRIGGWDRHQRVDIPAQDHDRRLEVSSRSACGGGWEDDRASLHERAGGLVTVGFSGPSAPLGNGDDVVLSFAIEPAPSPCGE